MQLNRFRRQLLSRPYLVRGLMVVIVLTAIVCLYFLFRPLRQIISPKSLPQSAGRINFLVLGVGGGEHDGPYLTDTIIFVSTKITTGETSLVSIPRDLWVPTLKAKINTAYSTGLAKQDSTAGLLLAKSAATEVIGQPINFSAVINFSTFIKAIDLVGGLDVTIDRAFTDSQYPIPGKENDLCDNDPDFKCRYETLTFSAGPQHFDGVTALKFVRSRHSLDELEGTDFGRSQRQEKVISAFKTKLISPEIIKRPQVYKDLYTLVSQSVVTDISGDYYSNLTQLGLKIRQAGLKNFSISEPGQVYNPPISSLYDYQWVLLPKDNNPQALFDYVNSCLP